MIISNILILGCRLLALFTTLTSAQLHHTQKQESLQSDAQWNSNITQALFLELEELSRIIDISYCVGSSGISNPFNCASHCSEFPTFKLVRTFHSVLGNSCGYIALDHGSNGAQGRILIVFRGTYNIPDIIMDLSTLPQEYIPYPPSDDQDKRNSHPRSFVDRIKSQKLMDYLHGFIKKWKAGTHGRDIKRLSTRCTNCTVHTGFWSSYEDIRPMILSQIQTLFKKYPAYRLDLVGHSLGGAIAALAGVELHSLGYTPIVTTFGEPRVGNSGLRDYIDTVFNLPSDNNVGQKHIPGIGTQYRRVTHENDPVPLLPLESWGYRSHAGEIFIAKTGRNPRINDVRLCFGDEDEHCMAHAEIGKSWAQWAKILSTEFDPQSPMKGNLDHGELKKRNIHIPSRYKIWQLIFAHRDYFWRLGLCIPGGDPIDWGRHKYVFEQ